MSAVLPTLYDDHEVAPCPFTTSEIEELKSTGEMLVYLPRKLQIKEMCDRWDIKTNFDPEQERMIRSVMVTEDQWFITSASPTPELLNQSAKRASRIYEDEGLYGLDIRRYIAFCAHYRFHYDCWPDQTYWTFLLSGSYDRSGVSIVGFDKHGVLSHHGWMRNFRAKFCGSRYIVIAPRIELTPETEHLSRARRHDNRLINQEASLDS
ncbi:MAG: hypothetical protein AAGD25_02490 [Cyanobacteria bacterium P01_F01_bin.150]